MHNTIRMGALSAFALLAMLPAQALGQDAVRQAGAKFRSSCVDCHTVPDKKFATDKAWLIRLKDTA